MLGLGETDEEVLEAMRDIRAAVIHLHTISTIYTFNHVLYVCVNSYTLFTFQRYQINYMLIYALLSSL